MDARVDVEAVHRVLDWNGAQVLITSEMFASEPLNATKTVLPSSTTAHCTSWPLLTSSRWRTFIVSISLGGLSTAARDTATVPFC